MTYHLAQLISKGATAIYGGARLATALATGDWADDGTVEARRGLCRGCPARNRTKADGADQESDWCGEPLLAVEGKSCGCVIALKTAVASESCPRGKWGAV